MASSNAALEKMKDLGIRHGEKAAMALAATLFVVFVALAFTAPSFTLTADEVKSHTQAAQQNITKPQNEEDLLKRLEDEGIKNPEFAKSVDQQKAVALDASKFALVNPWTMPEPGAGLIRDTPELIAPTDVYARAGRGGALLYKLNEEGKREVQVVKAEAPKRKRRPRRNRQSSSMYGSGGGYGSGGSGGARKNSAEEEAKRKEEREEKAKKLQESLAGSVDTSKEKTEEPENTGPENWKEETQGLRWAAIVGTVDYKQLRENYSHALKLDFSQSYPNFDRIDVQRQVRQPDGTWSDWEDVSREKNRRVLENMPEADEELTPDDVRLEAVADMLPFLRVGSWKGVHVASLVPKEKREMPKEQPQAGMGSGYYGSGMASGSGGMADSGAMMSPGSSGYSGGPSSGYQMRGGSSGSAMGFGPGMGGGSAAENLDFPKTEQETIMLRSLDFTVDPDTTYKFRIRLVVVNPNREREDVSPTVDKKAEFLFGPWSEPSNEVSVPADVTAYAMAMAPSGGDKTQADQVHFEVVRWDSASGVTVYKYYDAGPGQLLGDVASKAIPIFDEDDPNADQTTKLRPMDFTTRQLIVDTEGGSRPVPRGLGLRANRLDTPAMALMLRADGTLVLRDQAVDTYNDEMSEMKEIYDNALEEARESKKQGSQGSGMPGMPGPAGRSR